MRDINYTLLLSALALILGACQNTSWYVNIYRNEQQELAQGSSREKKDPFACKHQPVIVWSGPTRQGEEAALGTRLPQRALGQSPLQGSRWWETRKEHSCEVTLGTYEIFDLSNFTSPGLSLHTSKVGPRGHFWKIIIKNEMILILLGGSD